MDTEAVELATSSIGNEQGTFDCPNSALASDPQSQVSSTIEIANNTLAGHEMELNDDSVPVPCDSCKEDIIGNKWYRCTNCTEYDMCVKCFQNNAHSEHKHAIHNFSDYVCQDNETYCDSCGVVFRDDAYVYNCKEC